MKQYSSNSHPIENMPKITKEEFISNTNEMFEMIDSGRAGMVITDENKNEFVLCPSCWFDFNLFDDFGSIINCAVRYSLGRKSYMPSVVINFIREYMASIDKSTARNIVKDINRYLELVTENDVFNDEWLKLKEDLEWFLGE